MPQVTDTGLDYNSCFFVDEDGVEVEHGHYFEELGVQASALSTWSADNVNFQAAMVFAGGDFKFDLGRRKVQFFFGGCLTGALWYCFFFFVLLRWRAVIAHPRRRGVLLSPLKGSSLAWMEWQSQGIDTRLNL